MLTNHKDRRGDHADDQGRDNDEAKGRSEDATIVSPSHAARF